MELSGRIKSVGDDAQSAASQVRGLMGDQAAMTWIGASGDAFREAIGKFPGQLDKVADSYRSCATALLTYSGDLDTAPTEADRALTRARPPAAQISTLTGRLSTATATLTSATSG